MARSAALQRLLGRLLPVLALADRDAALRARAPAGAARPPSPRRAERAAGPGRAPVPPQRSRGSAATGRALATTRTTGRGCRRPRSRPRAATGSAGWQSTVLVGTDSRHRPAAGRGTLDGAVDRAAVRQLAAGPAGGRRLDRLAQRRGWQRCCRARGRAGARRSGSCRRSRPPPTPAETSADRRSGRSSPDRSPPTAPARPGRGRTTGTRIANSGRRGTSFRTISHDGERARARRLADRHGLRGSLQRRVGGESRFITTSPVSARETSKLTQSPLRASRGAPRPRCGRSRGHRDRSWLVGQLLERRGRGAQLGFDRGHHRARAVAHRALERRLSRSTST